MVLNMSDCVSVIPNRSDRLADQANIAAIDALNCSQNYNHIVAWGKFLGFTPQAVLRFVAEAELDRAPHDSIQKIDGRWLRMSDIQNESNQRLVDEIATHSR